MWSDVMMNNYGTPALTLVQGDGAEVTDSDGNTYIDLLAGIAVNVLGHNHPAVVQAVTEQISRLGHVSNLYASEPVVELATQLIKRFGADARVFFCNSGTEANEAAFKIARATGRPRILAAEHGFHGRTMGALALTGQPDKRKKFEPMPAGVEFYPYGDIAALTQLVDDSVAAIFLEPIQGETGVIPAPEGFLGQVRNLCDAHSILMVCDEVQTGVGRTGDFFAFQHEGVQPDVVTMAKGLGGGLPMGACLAAGPAATLLGPGDHGCTFGGNPVVAAAANAVLGIIDKQFLADVNRKGQMLRELLERLPQVVEVRGRGLMLGVVLLEPVAKQVVARGLEFGLLLNAPSDTVVRLTPPLIISDEQIITATNQFTNLMKELT